MMKKSAIAIAVAAALGTSAVAMAETTLYGSARVSVDWTNPNTDDFTIQNQTTGGTVTVPQGSIGYRPTSSGNFQKANTNKYLQVWDDSSRLGVRGSEDLGSGISAIYQYEFGVDVPGDNNNGVNGSNYFYSNRPRWVGLKGDFGALTLGTQFTPFYNVIGYTDTFNNSKTFDQDYYLRGTTTLQQQVLFQKGIAQLRRGSSVVYTTPNWRGLSAQGMVVMNGTPGANNVDQWEANLTYANGPWFAGGAIVQDRDVTYDRRVAGTLTEFTSSDEHDLQYGAAVGFDNKQFGVGFSWQQYKPQDTLKGVDAFYLSTGTANNGPGITGVQHVKVNAYTLQGQYYIGSEVLRLTGFYIKPDNTNSKLWGVEAGLQHNLSKRTRIFLEYVYSQQNFDHFNQTVIGPNGVPNTLSINNNNDNASIHLVSLGVRHDF